MILLDTDHLSVMSRPESHSGRALTVRLNASLNQPYAITIVSIVEQFRGWSAEINRAKDVAQEVRIYDRLSHFIDLIREMEVFPFDDRAADRFRQLRVRKIRIGTMDLEIAAIALANNSLLLAANRRDFAKVPELCAENWLV